MRRRLDRAIHDATTQVVQAVGLVATVVGFAKSERMWMHLPMGVANGMALVLYPTLGVGFLFCFAVYEVSQDHSIKDQSYQDIRGHMVGIGVVMVVVLMLFVLGVTWLPV